MKPFLVGWCCSILLLAGWQEAHATGIDEILRYRPIERVSVSPDGTHAACVVSELNLQENVKQTDVWMADLTSGHNYRLLRDAAHDAAPVWSPSGKWIAIRAKGAKSIQIWKFASDGGHAERVETIKYRPVTQIRWLPDEKGFLFTALDPSADKPHAPGDAGRAPQVVDASYRYARLYRYDVRHGISKTLTRDDVHIRDFDISPNGRLVVLSVTATPQANDRDQTDLKLLRLESGISRDLVVRPGSDTYPVFSPDGRWIAFVSHGGRYDPHGNTYVHVVRSDGTDLRNVSAAFDERIGTQTAPGVQWSSDGTHLYFVASQGMSTRLFGIDVASGRFAPVTPRDEGGACGAYSISRQGHAAAIAYSNPTIPEEVYSLDLREGAVERRSQINADFVGTAPITERLAYQSPDGTRLEGLVIKPASFRQGKRYPTLVIIHGGPASIHDYAFRPGRETFPNHAFADRDYVVFLPNPRGSAGYGEQFRKAVVQDWGRGDYQDIMAGVDCLIEQGVADPDRLGVMGWSYGGYLTAWIVTQTDRFKAASVGAGITNAISMYGTQDIPDLFESHFGGTPWDAAEEYLSRSPICFVANAKTPTLILHGSKDRRVPLSQSAEFYRGLKKVGVPVEMVVYPGQEHRFSEPALIKDALTRSLQWFDRWVCGIERRHKSPERTAATGFGGRRRRRRP